MEIQEIKDSMDEVKRKTGRHCQFKIMTTDHESRVYETYIASNGDNEICFVYSSDPKAALQRFNDFIEDSKIEVRAHWKWEEKRLLALLADVHDQLKTLED